MGEDLKKLPIVEIVTGLNLIYDIIERVRTRTGFEITPENISQHIAEQKGRRERLNTLLGVTQE